ncbi:hypothetical protein H6P81_010393 [Aristolochia fimbriata]|uniref:Uncharacterized protein n=1 Tax=Aristolochia fimbriata TaxID=158543 RepID=A0AAV7ENM5_ARIFI|nr:hypothetical protein H6P81_010393 [Aristolochia fimbriata]
MSQMEGGCPIDYNTIADLFLQSLVEFFGTLSREWALECMKNLLLVNLRGNLQITVQAANENSEQLGIDACIRLFQQFKSYEGLYFFLGSYLSSRLDPDIHFKYIEGAAKTGQIKDVKHRSLLWSNVRRG